MQHNTDIYKYDGISSSTLSSPSSVHLDSYNYDEYYENCEEDGKKREPKRL